MQLKLSHVIPHPIAEIWAHTPPAYISEVWQTECHFVHGNNYQVIATSGRGKSTLINILYGLRNDYAGTIHWGAHTAQHLTASDWDRIRQKHLSVVFQDLRLFPQLTAWENILAKAHLHPPVQEARLKQMAVQLDIAHRLHRPAHTLSQGERQRVAIIRALQQPFDWLLLDEPFSHLDPENIQRAIALITETCTTRKAGWILTALDTHLPQNLDAQHRLLL